MEPDEDAAGEKDGCRYFLVRKKLSGIKTGEGRNQEEDQTTVQK